MRIWPTVEFCTAACASRAPSSSFEWEVVPRQSRVRADAYRAGDDGSGSVVHRLELPADRCVPTVDDFVYDLDEVAGLCRWTKGTWTFDYDHRRKWNDLQNTPHDIQLLTNYLLSEYRARTLGLPVRKRRQA
jgi:hypothetical protein